MDKNAFISPDPASDDLLEELDETDRRLLDIAQTDFPLVSRPYAALAEQLGIEEDEAYTRIRKMRQSGVIRRLGANFHSRKLGHFSTLCAAAVPNDKKDNFIARVNAESGVTHNYERDHQWNIWFTLIAPCREKAAAILAAIERDTGIRILNLPATRMFKINVDFPMSNRE